MFRHVLGFALVITTLGCGKAGPVPDEIPVQGKVTFDEAPLETGRITFRQLEGPQQAFSGEIKNGSYAFKSGPGKMKVTVMASRVVPGKTVKSENGTDEPLSEMYIPAKYNDKSELTTDVKADGNNDFPFELISK